MTPRNFFHNKKAIIMGLGVFGGGAATANWIAQFARKVTVTDAKKKHELAASVRRIKPRDNIRFVLGKHDKKDFQTHDFVVVNPGVPRDNPYLAIARQNGLRFENVASILLRFVERPVIGVTGTRGKTTTASFISQFLSHDYGSTAPVGTPDRPLLDALSGSQSEAPLVAEFSSWQLEGLSSVRKGPQVAVITNLYADHLNRYPNIRAYARAKARIFAYQKPHDALILNYDNEWMPFFLGRRPKARLFFVSRTPLPKEVNGVFLRRGKAYFQCGGETVYLADVGGFGRRHGTHNVDNLLTALLAVAVFDPGTRVLQKHIDALATIPYRQETIMHKKGLTVINDSAATSPDASIAALERFGSPRTILIVGGTDKNLDFENLAGRIAETLPEEHLVLLEGSATRELVAALSARGYFKNSAPHICATLRQCLMDACAVRVRGLKTILFSPGAASFGLFRNEFDRGEAFTRAAGRVFNRLQRQA